MCSATVFNLSYFVFALLLHVSGSFIKQNGVGCTARVGATEGWTPPLPLSLSSGKFVGAPLNGTGMLSQFVLQTPRDWEDGGRSSATIIVRPTITTTFRSLLRLLSHLLFHRPQTTMQKRGLCADCGVQLGSAAMIHTGGQRVLRAAVGSLPFFFFFFCFFLFLSISLLFFSRWRATAAPSR